MLFTYKLTPPTLNDGEVTGGLADAAGRIVVAASGSVASGATDSGNPIKVGGKYNASAPTLTDGQRGDLQLDSSANLQVRVMGGAVASGATDSGNPIKIGGRYNATSPTLTDGQRGDIQLDSRANVIVSINGKGNTSGANVYSVTADGAAANAGLATWSETALYNGATWDRARGDTNGLVVQPGLSSTFWSYAGASGGITNTTDVAVKAAAGASVRNYVTGIQFKNTAAVASEIVIKDGSTVLWRGHVSASMSMSDGFTFTPPLRGTANTAVNVAMLTTSTATIVDVQGYTGA